MLVFEYVPLEFIIDLRMGMRLAWIGYVPNYTCSVKVFIVRSQLFVYDILL